MSTVRLLLYYSGMALTKPAAQDIGLWSGLREVCARMSPRRRRQLFLVLFLMFAGAFAELGTIGAVIPFLALLANGAGPSRHLGLFAVPSPSGDHPLLLAAVIFIAFAVAAAVIRLLLARSSRSFIFSLGHELTLEIQRRVLLQPYIFHIHRNTSTLLSALYKTDTAVLSVLLPLMHAVTSGLIALCVVALLLFIDPVTSLLVASALALTYGLISVVTAKRLSANSAVLESAYDDRLKVAQESLGGIRDVIIDDAQSMYLAGFAAVDRQLAAARSTTEFIGIVPRYLVEMVGMAAIAIVALVSSDRGGGFATVLPILGALALGAQRLLPLVQEVYAGWSTLQGQRSIFNQVIELMRLPVTDSDGGQVAALKLRDAIRLEEVSFTYPTRNRPSVERVSLTIARGSMVALVGPTGSGKSTFVDVLMGLLQPDSGRILVDDVPLTQASQRQWHRSIAHVPQAIFLTDSTIAGNIALSLPHNPPDPDRIVDATKKAQLHDFIVSLPSGYETYVGERGVRLSGGQRQRLGIARAIYKGAPILILDEATSALDELTETAVISALEALRNEGRTIIIIAHRLSTIRHCDVIARLHQGRLVELGSFATVLGSEANVS